MHAIATSALTAPHILLVDDDPVCRAAYADVLAEEFEVCAVCSGAEALGMLADKRFAVIVADMYMPEMDGVTLLAKVHELAPRTVKIMLTAHADLTLAMNALNESHIFGFYSKDGDPDALKAGVRKAVAHHTELRDKARVNSTNEEPTRLSAEEVAWLTRR